MPVIHERMPSGMPGDVSRRAGAVIEPVMAAQAVAFGAPVQLDASGRIVLAADPAKPIYGFVVRVYPTQSASQDEDAPDASGAVRPNAAADVLRSGYMTVRLGVAEPVQKGAPVRAMFGNVRGIPVSLGIAATHGNIIPNCFFMGEADAAGNVEIAFNI